MRHALINHFFVELVHAQPEGDIVVHLHVRENGVALKDHRDLAVARRQVGDIPPADADGAFVGHAQSGNGTQQGRLAAAAGPQQHQKLLVFHGNTDIVHCDEIAKALGDITDFDFSHGTSPLFFETWPHMLKR
jgi:hypothetical protein